MTSIYSKRRAALAAQLGAGGVAIVPTAPERTRNRDADFPYRHDSYFYYLTGFTEPNACLVLNHLGHSVLFCQPKDREREIWDGIRLGPEAAPAALGVNQAHPVNELDHHLPTLLENQTAVWFPFATHDALTTRIESWLAQVRSRVRMGVSCPSTQHDLCALLDEMRLIKDPHEQDTMRRAARISAGAHVRAMQQSARLLREKKDVREYHLEAELLHEFRRHGAQFPAYTSIVAAGANACVLHYRADNAPVKDGDLVLIDAGCELDGYASDITRTFPANGRFSGPQRTLYDIVWAAQTAAAHATRPGARFNDPHEAALKILSQGLLDTGVLSKDTHGSVDDVLANKAYVPFYMHRTSHWLGMDVHDCGSYVEPGEAGQGPIQNNPDNGMSAPSRPSRVLREGMVLTLEPGLYVRPGDNVPEAFWNIGIRIEDDAIVTGKGCELITRDVPVDADEIEALMRN